LVLLLYDVKAAASLPRSKKTPASEGGRYKL